MIDSRRLVEEDAAAYWALRLEAVEREPRSFGVTPAEHRLTTIEETVALISKSDSFLVGAFDGEALVGIARFDREAQAKERHKGHVRRVYVTASHRGRGVAKSLIAAIVAELKDDPTLEQLLLCVGTFNQGARAVYIAMGFVPFGVEPRTEGRRRVHRRRAHDPAHAIKHVSALVRAPAPHSRSPRRS